MGMASYHRPGTGWMKGEVNWLVLTKEWRYGDLKRVAGVG